MAQNAQLKKGVMKAFLRALALVALIFVPAKALSAGVRVTPIIQDAQLNEEQGEGIYTVLYTNSSSQIRELSIEAVDFGALDESGGVAFIGERGSDLKAEYGLVPWIELSSDSVVIPPNDTRSVRVRVLNKESLSPGGHYAAIIATVKQDAEDNEANQVQVNQRVASLLFLTKSGGEIHKLSVPSFDTDGSMVRPPSKFTVRIYNEGNTHSVPRGYVESVDPLGRTVRKGILNDASSIVLPETTKSLTVRMYDVRKALVPGRYVSRVTYRYDGTDSFATVESSRLVVPPLTLALGAAIIILIALLAYALKTAATTIRRRNHRR